MSGPAEQESLGELFARASADAKAFAQAEVNLATQRVMAKVRAIQWAAVMALVAVLLLFATLNALLVGLILVASGMPVSGWGTLIVVAVALLVIALLGWLAVQGFKRGLKAGGSS